MATRDDDDLLEELAIIALDIAGIFDPTGAFDLASGALSAKRGDWFSAGISLVSVVPVLGDLAKAGKLGKYAQTLQKVVRRAVANPAFRRASESSLRMIWEVLQKVNVNRLPTSVAAPLLKIQSDLGKFFGEAMTRVSGRVDWQILDAKQHASLMEEVGKKKSKRLVPAGLIAPEWVTMRVNGRVWKVGRDSTKRGTKGEVKGNVFKHFAERAERVPPHQRGAYVAMLEDGMAAVMAEFERQWLTGRLVGKLDDMKTAAQLDAKPLGHIFTTIDGWEIAVITRGDLWELRHVALK